MGRGLGEANSKEGGGPSRPRGMHGQLEVRGGRSQGDGWHGSHSPPWGRIYRGAPPTFTVPQAPSPLDSCCRCDFWTGPPRVPCLKPRHCPHFPLQSGGFKLLTGTSEAPGLLEAPASAQPTPRPLEAPRSSLVDTHPARVAHVTHTPAAALAGTHTHAHLPGPLHTNTAHTRTHTHTRQGPGSGRDLSRGGGGLGSAAVAPHSSPASKPPLPAAAPRTELCNWLENRKRNQNCERNQTYAHKVNLKSIAKSSHPPTPKPSQRPAAPGGGRPSWLCFLVAEGAPYSAGGSRRGLEHPLGVAPGPGVLAPSLAPGSRGWHCQGIGGPLA